MQLSFDLHFTSNPELALQRTVFRTSLYNQARVAVRGKTAWAIKSNASFEWSRAVRAMTKLFLMQASAVKAELRGTEAVTLEYALGKDPLWLCEMFCPEGQRGFLRRLFKRIGARHSPELSISLNSAIWENAAIRVWVDSMEYGKDQILHLIHALKQYDEADSMPAKQTQNLFKSAFETELRISLPTTEVLSTRTLQRYASFYNQLDCLKPFNHQVLTRWLSEYRPSNSQGSSKAQIISKLQNMAPIHITCPAANIANMAVFEWMRLNWKLPIKISTPFATAYWLVAALANDTYQTDCDILSLGLVPALRYLELKKTTALLPYMPSCTNSQSIVSADIKTSQTNRSNKLHYFQYEPSNLAVVTDPMYSKFAWQSFAHSSHSEIMNSIKDPHSTLSGAVVAPFGAIASQLGGKSTYLGHDPCSQPVYFLFAKADFLHDERAKLFEQAFRRAWLEMLFHKDGWRKSASYLANNHEVCFQLIEEGGLHGLLT